MMGKMNWTVGTHIEYNIKSQTKQHQQFDQANKCGKCMLYNVRTMSDRERWREFAGWLARCLTE